MRSLLKLQVEMLLVKGYGGKLFFDKDRKPHLNRQASFGCAIARDFWGKAFAYEASRAIIGFSFSTLPVHRIYAETNGDNWRARKQAERLGMRLEALLKEVKFSRDRWWDTAVYAVLKDEWGRRAVGDSPTAAASTITGEAG